MTETHPKAVTRYAEMAAIQPLRQRLRAPLRDLAIRLLSLKAGRPARGAIHFPYYHHVFQDERRGFDRQLRWMRDRGEFASLDQALELLGTAEPLDGCYFCITFDDGFETCHSGALPILADHAAPAAFFVVTGMIGKNADDPADLKDLLSFYDHGRLLVPFMDWDQVRALHRAGMTIGSHTTKHLHLADATPEEISEDLIASKKAIEAELGQPCRHFCCPWGQPDIDFRTDRDPKLAEGAGFESFLTTARGANRPGTSAFAIRRDHVLANWGAHQLSYFFQG
ncbi:MAG: polysaccharide deacetylase family protein [Magnetovibrionaceae bacterium]